MVEDSVLSTYNQVSLKYIGNTNSLHKLGLEAKKLENAATNQIIEVLGLKEKEIIYTSDRCEANALAILGLLDKYKFSNKNIIFFDNCDLSILGLKDIINKFGINVNILSVKDSAIDLNSISKVIDKDTVLVCTSYVSNINEVDNFLKQYNRCNLLIDITDNFSLDFDFSLGDFISFDASSCNGILGIGCLLKNKRVIIEPLYHGGKSTTIYRSGTPALPLIVAFSKAIKLMHNSK